MLLPVEYDRKKVSNLVAYKLFDKILHFLYIFEKRNSKIKLECGPMPNLMVALPNIGGALCSTPQSLADAHY